MYGHDSRWDLPPCHQQICSSTKKQASRRAGASFFTGVKTEVHHDTADRSFNSLGPSQSSADMPLIHSPALGEYEGCKANYRLIQQFDQVIHRIVIIRVIPNSVRTGKLHRPENSTPPNCYPEGLVVAISYGISESNITKSCVFCLLSCDAGSGYYIDGFI